jgi:hypothetical protein
MNKNEYVAVSLWLAFMSIFMSFAGGLLLVKYWSHGAWLVLVGLFCLYALTKAIYNLLTRDISV